MHVGLHQSEGRGSIKSLLDRMRCVHYDEVSANELRHERYIYHCGVYVCLYSVLLSVPVFACLSTCRDSNLRRIFMKTVRNYDFLLTSC